MNEKEAYLLSEEMDGELQPGPCANLLLSVIDQARRDALEGIQSAIEWFNDEWFIHYADYLGLSPEWIRAQVWVNVMREHPGIDREEWFARMVRKTLY